MFRWGIIFLVIALIAAALGFGGLAGTAAGAAKIVFVVGLLCYWCVCSWALKVPCFPYI